MGTVWHPPRVAQSRMLLTVLDVRGCGGVARAELKDRVLRWEGRVVDARMAFDGVSDAEAAWNAVAKAHMSDDPLSCLGVLREMGTCAENPIEPSQCCVQHRGDGVPTRRTDWARAMIGRMRKIAARTGDPNMYPDAVTYHGGARGGGGGARVPARSMRAGRRRWSVSPSSGAAGSASGSAVITAPSSTRSSRTAPSMSARHVYTAENEPGVDLPARISGGDARARRPADVGGVAVLAERPTRNFADARRSVTPRRPNVRCRDEGDASAVAKEDGRVERDVAAAAAAARPSAETAARAGTSAPAAARR